MYSKFNFAFAKSLLNFQSSTHFECLLQCGKPCESADSIVKMNQGALEKLIKLKSLNWMGCDRFGNAYDSVDWELEPHGKHLRASCRLNSVKLKRSKLRQQKQDRESAFS